MLESLRVFGGGLDPLATQRALKQKTVELSRPWMPLNVQL